MQRAILFDFNGVIVNDEPQHCEALMTTLSECGIPLTRDEYYRDYLGFDDHECFRFSFERRGLRADAGTVEAAIRRKAELYRRAIHDSLELVPGSAEFVRRASHEGYRMGVVSGALREEIELVLGLAGLRELFGVVVASEDVESCKPDPGGYRKAVDTLSLPVEHCVVIEDSLPGLAAARAAGLRCVMLATSHPIGDLRGADLAWSDLVGRSPADLPWAA
jgi:HAD superfamily hydrolase (TIGR01509 family)